MKTNRTLPVSLFTFFAVLILLTGCKKSDPEPSYLVEATYSGQMTVYENGKAVSSSGITIYIKPAQGNKLVIDGIAAGNNTFELKKDEFSSPKYVVLPNTYETVSGKFEGNTLTVEVVWEGDQNIKFLYKLTKV